MGNRRLVNAQNLGFDAIATTLNGYTEISTSGLPNINLVHEITQAIQIPIIAEGGYVSPEQVRAAIRSGAWAVCVGTAITNPYLLTQNFINEGL